MPTPASPHKRIIDIDNHSNPRAPGSDLERSERAFSAIEFPMDSLSLPLSQSAIQQELIGEIMESIRSVGHLIDPIHARHYKNDFNRAVFEIIPGAGVKRFWCAQILGWKTIPVVLHECNELQAELIGVDSNLMREHLTALERCDLKTRRLAIVQQLGLINQNSVGNQHLKAPTIEEFAKSQNMTYRYLRQNVQISVGIRPEIKQYLYDSRSPILNSIGDLLKVARAGTELAKQLDETNDPREVKQIEEQIAIAQSDVVRKLEAARAAKAIAPAKQRIPVTQPPDPTTSDGKKTDLLVAKAKKLIAASDSTQVSSVHFGAEEPEEWLTLSGGHQLFAGDPQGNFWDEIPDLSAEFGFAYYSSVPGRWDLDRLADKAKTVAIACEPDQVFRFARVTKMPYEQTIIARIKDAKDEFISVCIFSKFSTESVLGIQAFKTREELLAYLLGLFPGDRTKPSKVILPYASELQLLICNHLGRQAIAASTSYAKFEQTWRSLSVRSSPASV